MDRWEKALYAEVLRAKTALRMTSSGQGQCRDEMRLEGRCGGISMSQSIKVQIFGQSFSIQGELDEAYVQKLAAYVNQKMSAISEMAPTVDTQRLAIMAALAIADELHSLKEERVEREEILKEQAERCLNLVERALMKKD